MRVVGVVMIALGIVMMIIAVFPLLDGQVLLTLGCLTFIAVPLFVTGIVIVRRYEDRQQAAARPIDHAETEEATAATFDDPTTLPDTISSFDLNSLNWRGWLLLLATGAVVAGQFPLIAWITESIDPKHRKFVVSLLCAGAVYLAWWFWRAMRWVLTRMGWPIFRSETSED
jgi:hypothetical protein